MSVPHPAPLRLPACKAQAWCCQWRLLSTRPCRDLKNPPNCQLSYRKRPKNWQHRQNTRGIQRLCQPTQRGLIAEHTRQHQPYVTKQCRHHQMPAPLGLAIRALANQHHAHRSHTVRYGIDCKFLALAMACNAGVLVSSDDDLLSLKNWHGTQIVSPAAFLTRSVN